MNKVRVAFFADLHIRKDKIQSQTDFGAPSKWIPRKAQEALNDIQPDCIFGLGDLTAAGHRKDWLGYQRWLKGVKAPVFDLMGNHDRDYTVFHSYNYGEEYFSVLGRVSDTKVVKIGNLVFVLVSEEHDPEGNRRMLTSSIPLKKLKFVQEAAQKYGKENNVFILSHTLLRGTTALSNDWSFNDIGEWNTVSQRFFKLFREQPVVAHVTGHTHMDYRYRARLKDIGRRKYKKKVGKFVNGREYDYLPNIYFLNMPCVDTAHGWLGSNFALLRTIGKATARAKRSPLRRLYIKLEEKGMPVFDILYKSKINNILGRPAVYYFEVFDGQKEVKVVTRWLGNNKDMERCEVALNTPYAGPASSRRIVSSDLSLRNKNNLFIGRDSWFGVPARNKGTGWFSQGFPESKKLVGLEVSSQNLESHTAWWQGSGDYGKTWTKKWVSRPEKLGRVNAVKLKMEFRAGSSPAKIKDIRVLFS